MSCQNLTHLVGCVGLTQVVGYLSVNIVQHPVAHRPAGLLALHQDAQGLACHLVFVTVHPRQQTAVAQTQPLVVTTLLIAEGMDNLCQRGRGVLGQERYLRVYLVNQSQDSHAGVYIALAGEIAA